MNASAAKSLLTNKMQRELEVRSANVNAMSVSHMRLDFDLFSHFGQLSKRPTANRMDGGQLVTATHPINECQWRSVRIL